MVKIVFTWKQKKKEKKEKQMHTMYSRDRNNMYVCLYRRTKINGRRTTGLYPTFHDYLKQWINDLWIDNNEKPVDSFLFTDFPF